MSAEAAGGGSVRVGPVRREPGEARAPAPAPKKRRAADRAPDREPEFERREDQKSHEDFDAPPRAAPRRGGGRGRILRLGLPLAALATIAAVFWLSRPSYKANNFDIVDGLKLQSGMELANPRYMGATTDNQPFTISAATARPDGPDPSQIALDKVVGDITLKDGKEATLTADVGIWERDSNQLRLSGGVVVTTSDGYQMVTDALLAKIESREIITDGDVKGEGPVGQLEAGRARFTDANDGVAWFEDGVKVRIVKLVKSRATGE